MEIQQRKSSNYFIILFLFLVSCKARDANMLNRDEYDLGNNLFIHNCKSCHIGKDTSITWTSYNLEYFSNLDSLHLKSLIFSLEDYHNGFFNKTKFSDKDKHALFFYIKNSSKPVR